MFIFLWRDLCEIIFFVTLFNCIMQWLTKDESKKLYGYFLCYLALSGICYVFALQTVTTFLWWYSPVIALLFVLLHQETLQKNFITPKNKSIDQHNISEQWPDILISVCLHNMNQVKATICIIERACILDSLFEIPFTLQVMMDSSFLAMLCESPSYDEQKMIIITQQGTVKAINSIWKKSNEINDLKTSATQKFALFDIDQAHKITEKTDALVMIADPVTRLFTIMVHDVRFYKINAVQTVQLIKKHILSHQSLSSSGEMHAKKNVYSNNQSHS